MNEKFRNSRGQEITFTDDNIIFGAPSILNKGEVFEECIPYGRIKNIKFAKKFGIPSVDIIDKETVDGKLNIHHGYIYEMYQKDKLAEMIKFAKGQIKCAVEIEPPKPLYQKIDVIEHDSFNFKYENRKLRFRSNNGLLTKTIPVSALTTCKGMSYHEDIAYQRVKITFYIGNDYHIIEGRTWDTEGKHIKYIPYEEYYDNMIKDSDMPSEEKITALNNKSYEGAELLAKATLKQAGNPITPKEKDASVVGRAVIGAAIAGSTGAIVGALSAVDQNNKNKK